MNVATARRLLGLDADASSLAIKRAQRRLALAAHPDVGGSADHMREINEAAAVLLADLDGPPAVPPRNADRQPRSQPAPAAAPVRPRPGDGITHDVASFVIEALPAEAFEALLVVTTWIGEVVADEPPYQLDVLLHQPIACWCRLDLVPDAGASTVALTIQRTDPARPLPDIDTVRDVWVAALNELGDGDRRT